MLTINETISLPLREIDISQIRASGPGGQNVNKVATAVHIRFDIINSSLPQHCKEKLLSSRDRRLTTDGCLIIKAQQYRTLEKNKEDGLKRLAIAIATALKTQKKRKPTRPSASSKKRRLAGKQKQSQLKAMRRKVSSED